MCTIHVCVSGYTHVGMHDGKVCTCKNPFSSRLQGVLGGKHMWVWVGTQTCGCRGASRYVGGYTYVRGCQCVGQCEAGMMEGYTVE